MGGLLQLTLVFSSLKPGLFSSPFCGNHRIRLLLFYKSHTLSSSLMSLNSPMEATFALPTLFFLTQLLCFTSGFQAYDEQNTEYIKTSCTNTTYPRLCYRSLSIYANKIQNDPKLLAKTALNVTFVSTRSTSRLMKRISRIHNLRPRVAAAVADCVELVGDSVDELQESIGEMGGAGGGKSFWLVMSDIQTWVSAALTDDDTCMDGFDGKAMKGRVKILVRKHILRISRLTSNALALVNNYASSQAALP